MKKFDYITNSNVSSRTLYDEGLRQYFLKIYTLMSTGLAITALAAFSVFSIPFLTRIMFNVTADGYFQGMTSVGTLVSFAPLAISLYFAFGSHRINTDNARTLFLAFAALMGLSLGSLGFIYTGASITKTFLICSGMFGGMSLYGYSTKKDLTSFGSFLFMGLLGLVLASVINFWFRSPAIEFVLSVIGVFIFTGLIAYDTQKLKSLYFNGATGNDKLGIMGALTLYLDFINLFIYLLRFLGVRKSNE
jgi:FtsH-binding integral membrane protein